GDHGRMTVDGTMRSVSHPEVYGIGDAAAAHRPDGRELRMGCGPGGFGTVCAVHAIVDRLAGRTPRQLRVEVEGHCISLGRKDGLVEFVDLDGRRRGPFLIGRLAAIVKETIVRGAALGQRHPALAVAAARRTLT